MDHKRTVSDTHAGIQDRISTQETGTECCDCCTAENVCGGFWLTIGCGFIPWVLFTLTSLLLRHVCCWCCIPGKKIANDFQSLAVWYRDPFIIQVKRLSCGRCCGCCCNIICIFPFGLLLALYHFVFGLLYLPCHVCGCPFGLAHLKLGCISLAPMGLEVKTYEITYYNTSKSFGGCKKIYEETVASKEVRLADQKNKQTNETMLQLSINSKQDTELVDEEGNPVKYSHKQ